MSLEPEYDRAHKGTLFVFCSARFPWMRAHWSGAQLLDAALNEDSPAACSSPADTPPSAMESEELASSNRKTPGAVNTRGQEHPADSGAEREA